MRIWMDTGPTDRRRTSQNALGGAFRALVEVGSRARITAGFSEPPQKKKISGCRPSCATRDGRS